MSSLQSPASVPFDPRALTEPVDPIEAREHARAIRAGGASHKSQTVTKVVLYGVVGIIVLAVFIPTAISVLVAFFNASGTRPDGSVASFADVATPILIIAALVFGGIVLIRSASRKQNERLYRLRKFAEANGMHFILSQPSPPLSGMIFQLGRNRVGKDILRGTSPRFVEIGNYDYTTGSGKDQTTHTWGYIAIHLDVPLPHMVLDATGNNSLFGTNLPASFSRSQRLQLEGDFNKYFSLYCPKGYEQDALYLFTPDIMSRFIDHAATLDVEIIDDWLFLYSKRQFTTLDPNTWAWLFSTVNAVTEKFSQWARWRDERLAGSPSAMGFVDTSIQDDEFHSPPPGVAREGQRLKRSYTWSAVAIGGITLLWIVIRIIGGN